MLQPLRPASSLKNTCILFLSVLGAASILQKNLPTTAREERVLRRGRSKKKEQEGREELVVGVSYICVLFFFEKL